MLPTHVFAEHVGRTKKDATCGTGSDRLKRPLLTDLSSEGLPTQLAARTAQQLDSVHMRTCACFPMLPASSRS